MLTRGSSSESIFPPDLSSSTCFSSAQVVEVRRYSKRFFVPAPGLCQTKIRTSAYVHRRIVHTWNGSGYPRLLRQIELSNDSGRISVKNRVGWSALCNH